MKWIGSRKHKRINELWLRRWWTPLSHTKAAPSVTPRTDEDAVSDADRIRGDRSVSGVADRPTGRPGRPLRHGGNRPQQL